MPELVNAPAGDTSEVAALRRRVTELERENETYQWAADLLALQNQVLEAVAAGLPRPSSWTCSSGPSRSYPRG